MNLTKRWASTFLAVGALVLLSACSDDAATKKELYLGSTSTTRDSGILSALKPAFEKEAGCEIVVLCKGTGAILRDGQDGHIDILLVHSPSAEKSFVAKGHGTQRLPVMESGYLIAGPASDPAGIHGLTISEALKRIAQQEALFVSRGDSSGTHHRELGLWEKTGGKKVWADYVETGRGMGATLITAQEMQAYVLVERATFANFQSKIDLVAHVEGGAALANPYHAICVKPSLRPLGDDPLVERFAAWLQGKTAQKLIAGFTIEGKTVFRPGVSGD